MRSQPGTGRSWTPITARGREAPAEDGLQLTLGSAAEDEVLDRLRRAKIETMSPIEAMNLLYELKRKLEG